MEKKVILRKETNKEKHIIVNTKNIMKMMKKINNKNNHKRHWIVKPRNFYHNKAAVLLAIFKVR